MREARLIKELKHIQDYYEFSEFTTEHDREFLLNSGLVDFYEGTLMLTPSGESYLGNDDYNDEPEEDDITEVFKYNDDGEYDDEESF